MKQYRCLQCGSLHGEPTSNSAENWYWLTLEHGKVGPFCSSNHAHALTINGGEEPSYTLRQLSDFSFLRYRYQEGL